MFFSIYQKYMDKLATEINAECCSSGELEVVAGQHRFRMYLFPACEGGPYVPGYFQLKTKMPQPWGAFGVRRNDVLDWIAERIYFKQDLQVGDEDFDSKFFIEGEDEAWATQFFSKEVVRNKISDLLSRNFDKIYAEAGELFVIKYVKSADDFPSTSVIHAAIQTIQQIQVHS